MNKIILSTFFLFLFLGIASSDLCIITAEKDFKTSTELNGTYSQECEGLLQNEVGYHKAEISFKTKIPSFNPDQSGVKNIDCMKSKDGNKIAFNLKDKDAIETVNNWPDKVMLLISHKWKCFDEKSTQFFMVTNRNVDESSKKVTFDAENCNATDWSEDYSIDLFWVAGRPSNRIRAINKRFGIPFPTIHTNNKISLNTLFDGRRKSSKPNVPIISNSDLKLLCTNCFTSGDATISTRFAGKIFPPKLNEASISINGNFLLNLDLALQASVGKSFSDSVNLVSIPLSPFSIPGVFNIGPSINLVAEADVAVQIKGTLEFGGDLSLPNFSAKASFKGTPSFEQSGFKPKVRSHEPKGKINASANISGSLKPQLAFGVNVLNGRILDQKVGFEVVGTLDNTITIGSQSGCNRRVQPHLKSTLGGNLGFFADDSEFPVVEFPTLTLLDKCIF